LQQEELEAVKWFDKATLEEEVKRHPEKFGYRFDLIMGKTLSYLG